MKKGEFMKKAKYYILSVIIPFLILLTVLIMRRALNGEFNILVSDLYGQYYKLFFHIKNNLLQGSNIFYSFNKGLGGGMISTYAYYLISPFNLLLIFNNTYLITVLMILFKISLCGLTFFTFLRYHFKDEKNIYLLIFAIAYSLSLYNIANYFQVMWLDNVILAPLILLGIDKLIFEKKPLLYGITLFIAILTNYYIGYMVCIFSLLYFLYKSILYKKYNIKDFVIVSFLSGMMTMFVNIPNILATLQGNRMTKTYVGLINSDYFAIISKMFLGGHDYSNILNAKTPHLYCGIFVIPLILLYFLNKKINKREKILSFIMILILILSIIISPINYMWHLFSPPNYFNYRYLFLFIAFILYLSCRSFFNLKHLNKKDYYIVAPILPITGLFLYVWDRSNFVVIYVSILLYILYLFMFYNLNKNKMIKILLVLVCIFELYFNINYIFYKFNFSYSKHVNGRDKEQLESHEFLKQHDSSFYRYDHDANHNFNSSFQYNYNSVSTWLSTLNLRLEAFDKLGFNTGINHYKHFPYPITDSLFGLKYYETIKENNLYNKIYSHKVATLDDIYYGIDTIDSYIYENPYALSIGYFINNNNYEFKYDNSFENQMDVLFNMTNINNPVYQKKVLTKENNEYIYEVNNNDFSLLYNINIKSDEYEYHVIINDDLYEIKRTNDVNITNVLNKYNGKIRIRFEVKSGELEILDVASFVFNKSNFEQYINYLKTSQLNISEIKDGYLKGNIDIKKDGLLFLSIPYEKGWTAYIDKEKVEIEKIYDTFIVLPINTGNHDVELIYYTPGLKTGIIVSILSGLMFVIFIRMKK